jgi:hypothetical protein
MRQQVTQQDRIMEIDRQIRELESALEEFKRPAETAAQTPADAEREIAIRNELVRKMWERREYERAERSPNSHGAI